MNRFAKLAASLVIDAIGMLVAGPLKLGELIWAPLSAFLIWKLYHRDFYMFLDFVEEILPGTEFIPTATIAWLDEYGYLNFMKKKETQDQAVWLNPSIKINPKALERFRAKAKR